MDADSPTDLESFYRDYLRHCNEHRFDELQSFIAEDVRVNGRTQGSQDYIAGLEAVVTAFPDYTWSLQHLLIDGPWVAAHFIDTGTHQDSFLDVPATGRTVSAQEFAFYRVEAGKIAEVWVAADNLYLVSQLRRRPPG